MKYTYDDLRTGRGPGAITVPQAGQILGICSDSAYSAAKRGDLPTIKMGRRLLVPTQALLELLGHEPSKVS